MSELIAKVVAAVKNLLATEPAVVYAAVASVVVFVAAHFGIVVDQTSVIEALAYVVPILLAGVGTRAVVQPVSKK
jgi:hypothetical protein